MDPTFRPTTSAKARRGVFYLLLGVLLFVLLISSGVFYLWKGTSQPKVAPESERVLQAQLDLPFQVLIPAYLPPIFLRDRMEIRAGENGPGGLASIQLLYPTRKSNQMIITEWIVPETSDPPPSVPARRCMCMCASTKQCTMTGAEFVVGNIHINVEFSVQNLLSFEQMQLVLDTLGPAANQLVYSDIKDVPLTFSAPPAVEIPVTAEGVQEVLLVVTSQGYDPAHFSVVKDVPVRLTFVQLGQVGCGNEVTIEWGPGSRHLVLETASDKEVIEFTPGQAGEYLFHCSHYIYRGLMTVVGE
jgi:hypothetical protein